MTEDATTEMPVADERADQDVSVPESSQDSGTPPTAGHGGPARAASPGVAPEAGAARNSRKVREGLVVSDGMRQTRVVAVVERVRHPRYAKTVQRTKRLYVHDEDEAAKVGDRVRVAECRPISKLKRWRLLEIVERAR